MRRAAHRPRRRVAGRDRQACRAGRPRGARAHRPHARRRARRPARRRGRPAAPGDRPPAGQGHLRADDRRPQRTRRIGVLAAQIKAPRGEARPISRWWRAIPGRAPGRSTRRWAATTGRRSGARSAAAGRADGAHPLQGARAAARDALVEARLETGPHAPGPRPLRGDRPPGGGRPPVRAAPAATASPASSCTARGSGSATRSPDEELEFARRCPRTWRGARSARARGAPVSAGTPSRRRESTEANRHARSPAFVVLICDQRRGSLESAPTRNRPPA